MMEVENTVMKKMPMEKFFPAFVILSFATLALAACAQEPVVDEIASWDGASVRIIAALPEPHANNAVAMAASEDGASFWSFNGLGAGKTYQDVSKASFVCKLPGDKCRAAGDVPVAAGRLASTAVFLYDRIFLFGGYTVAADGTETSTPEVFAFNPETEEYKRRADMPTPVDDAVAFSYANRYIYLVSGWHDDGNVSAVQGYDTWEDKWFTASEYPGAPVFGHAGGAVRNMFVIADGVGVVGEKDGRRQFGAVDEVWLGEIDPVDPTNITWRKLPPHPGAPLYRMAAAGDPEHNRIVFYGGGDNPYNYNGVGYDGVPARASDVLFAFELETDQWIELGRTGRASMDHRGLMIWDGAYWTLGGMNDAGDVTGDLVRIDIVE
jgi:Kelch motif